MKLWRFTTERRIQFSGKHYLNVCLQSAFEGCIQYILPVTLGDFFLGVDTAKTDLSFHSALEALVIFDNILYWAWLILSQGESMQTVHRSGQKILATFVCYSKSHFTERQDVYSFCWNLNRKICLAPSMEFGIKMKKENEQLTAVWGPEHLYGYCLFGFIILFCCSLPQCLQPHRFSFLQVKYSWNFKCFVAWKEKNSYSPLPHLDRKHHPMWGEIMLPVKQNVAMLIWWPHIIPGI